MAPEFSFSETSPKAGKSVLGKGGVEAINDGIQKRSLKSTINRARRVKSQYRQIPAEGQRVSENVQEKGRTLALVGEERADQLRSIIDEAVGQVMQSSSKDNSMKTALIEAINAPSPVEAGKGTNLSSQA